MTFKLFNFLYYYHNLILERFDVKEIIIIIIKKQNKKKLMKRITIKRDWRRKIHDDNTKLFVCFSELRKIDETN